MVKSMADYLYFGRVLASQYVLVVYGPASLLVHFFTCMYQYVTIVWTAREHVQQLI